MAASRYAIDQPITLVTNGSSYLCAGAFGSCDGNPRLLCRAPPQSAKELNVGWTPDASDLGNFSKPYVSVGHAASGCTAYTYGNQASLSVAAIGMSNAPSYTLFKNGSATHGNSSVFENFSYSVANASSFVVITAACEHPACSFAVPSRCTIRQNLEGSDNYDQVYIATCQSQPVGTYYVNISAAFPHFVSKYGYQRYYVNRQAGAVEASFCASCYNFVGAAYVYSKYSPTGS